MALRESPIRRRPPSRPPWLIPLLAVVAILVVVGVVYGIVMLVRGPTSGAESAPQVSSSPSCTVVEQALGETLPQPEKVAVNVYNATQTPGLAGKTAKAVKKAGFSVVNVDNEPSGKVVTGIAEIRYGRKAKAQAELMRVYVPGADLVPVDRKGKAVDLVLGDAFAGLASPEEIDAALAAPAPQPSGASCAAPSASSSPGAGE